MRCSTVMALVAACLGAVPLPGSAEVLRGADRRAFEKATSEGTVSTACRPGSPDFVFWAGTAPSSVSVGGVSQPVHFEQHKVGDYLSNSFRCRTSAGPLTVTTKLTHTVSNSECGAGNDVIATFAMPHVGSYSTDFLTDGCLGTTAGVLVRGKTLFSCHMDDDKTGVGTCTEVGGRAGWPSH